MEAITAPDRLDLDPDYARRLAAQLAAGSDVSVPAPPVLADAAGTAAFTRALTAALGALGAGGALLAERTGQIAADSSRAVDALAGTDADLSGALGGGGEALW